jgi:hypothetical protein
MEARKEITVMRLQHTLFRNRWWMPGFSLFLGALVLGAFWIGDRPREGVWGFAVMAALGALFLFGSRSETLRGLGGPGRDERWAMIDGSATAFAGHVLIGVVIGAWLVDIARGGDGGPYGQLGAIAGLSYIAGVAWHRLRS